MAASIIASSSSNTTAKQDAEVVTAASCAVAAAEEALNCSTSDGGSPTSEQTEESLPSNESDSTEDPYQKIIATLREQIKSTNEELKKNGKVTNQNVKRVGILRRQKAGLEGILKATQEGNPIKVRLFARQLSQIHKDMIKEMEKEKHRVQNQISALEEQVTQHQERIRQSKGKGRQ